MERAAPSTLIDFRDSLANVLLSLEDTWSVEFRTYRTQIVNYSDQNSKLMYSINFSHHGNNTVMVKNGMGILTSSDVNNSKVQNLIENDCSTGFPDTFDALITNKLTNMWEQRQILKGDAGETFKTMTCIIRCVNLFSSTGFKGLVIEIEDTATQPSKTQQEFDNKIDTVKELLNGISIKEFQISQDTLDTHLDDTAGLDYLCNLAYQYVRVLEY